MRKYFTIVESYYVIVVVIISLYLQYNTFPDLTAPIYPSGHLRGYLLLYLITIPLLFFAPGVESIPEHFSTGGGFEH